MLNSIYPCSYVVITPVMRGSTVRVVGKVYMPTTKYLIYLGRHDKINSIPIPEQSHHVKIPIVHKSCEQVLYLTYAEYGFSVGARTPQEIIVCSTDATAQIHKIEVSEVYRNGGGCGGMCAINVVL